MGETTNDPAKSDDQTELESVLRQSTDLLARQRTKRNAIREKSKPFCAELLDAHWLATGVIANATTRVGGIAGVSDNDIGQRLSLTASFVQGIDICECAIYEGLYVAGAALLK